MKYKILFVLLLNCISSVYAYEYAADNMPGEPTPWLCDVAKKDGLELYSKQNKGSKKRTIYFKKGWRIVYDKVRYFLLEPVPLTALTEVELKYCGNEKTKEYLQSVKIPESTVVNYLVYLGEGDAHVRYGDYICQVFIRDDTPKFEGLDKPIKTELWVRVVGGDKTPFGWLDYYDEEQFTFQTCR